MIGGVERWIGGECRGGGGERGEDNFEDKLDKDT